MRICVVSIMNEESSTPWLDRLRESVRMVVRPDTEVGIKSASPGFSRLVDVGYSYFLLSNKLQIIEKFIEAEKEGYDAVMPYCGLDLGVREAREILEIPVIGPTEASMHLACQLGDRFGIVLGNVPKLADIVESLIKLYRLQDRVIHNPIRLFSASIHDLTVTWVEDPNLVVPDVTYKAEELVKDGAEVIINVCGAVTPMATMMNLVKVGEKDIPILNCPSVGLKTAEMIVDLRKKTGIPTTSRAKIYAQPKKKHISRIRTEFGLTKT